VAESFKRWEWLVGGIVAVLPVLLIGVPLFLLSENVHTVEESTAFDRLRLSMRTFWPTPTASFWRPSTWRIDTNFPLGTAVLFALPNAFGLESAFWGRVLSGISALIATGCAFRLFAPRFGPLLGGVAAAFPWCSPAFARGAVLSGEELLFTASLLVALVGLIEGRRWIGVSLVAANAMVLFRLDAMVVLPAYGLLALALLGRRRGLMVAAASGVSSLLHVGITWATTGDPLAFARLAQGVTAATTREGPSMMPAAYLAGIAEGLGHPALLGLAAVGAIVAVLRGGRSGRAWAFVAVYLLLAYMAVGASGILKLQFTRYLVPVFVLTAVLVPISLAAVGPPRSVLAATLGAVLLGFCLHGSAKAVTEHAVAARVPTGLEAAAHWLAMCGQGETALVTSHLPALTVLGPLPPDSVDQVKTRWNWLEPPPVSGQMSRGDVKFVVLVGAGPVVQAVREARTPGWRFAWQEHSVSIYARASDEEQRRLLSCTRW
jgi:hypothetical protein